ncbi:uncharacterized protein LOC134028268 [Osmerus eperlanus]|uniref:uncharacterized protein LOC134028268 n=1 Tax=Osmerus eperlanus TaxID=29151 RepID=UPI002E138A1D
MQESRTHGRHAQPASSGYQAPLTWTGAMGAPHYQITGEQLRFLMSCAFSLSQMAEILHVSRSTVKRRLRRLNLSQAGRFSDLSDTALDDKVKDLVAGNDRLGPESVRAQLRAEGIRVQRRRVRDSMLRVKPRAAALRAMSQRLHRRSYRVAGPNSLWHLDGNHKLIRWRIVIHGGIDGYSRLVVFLRASSNNRSSTAQDGEAQDGVAGTPVVHWIERVTIPPNRFTLGNALMQVLAAQINPLGGLRTALGMDILQEVISFLESSNDQ